ncbi:MAG: hypothetical protein IPN34_17210 [Planctomycetes bacterium]|nr:hypothetical protein [Planctomycetota bacterium]
MTGSWIAVTSSEPCSICGHASWCTRSADGRKIICRRLDRGDGKAKVDKSGMPFWLYRADGSPGERTDQVVVPQPSVAPKRASDADLDCVYGALLDRCQLSDAHRENLRSRGLSDEEIGRGRYGSLPPKKRSSLAKALLELFPLDLLQQVPGFGSKQGANGPYATIFGAAGLLVPVRSAEGRIVALKVRADQPGDGPKYTYLSSGRHGGPGSGARDHYPLNRTNRGPRIRITEGELKADVATAKSDIYTIGVPGIGRFSSVLTSIPASDEIRLAPDSDARTNPHVARSVLEAIAQARTLGLNFSVETWSPEIGKGIDDALSSRAEIRVLRGEEIAAFEARLLELLGDHGSTASPSFEPQGGLSFSDPDLKADFVAAVAYAQEHGSPETIYQSALLDRLARLPSVEVEHLLAFLQGRLKKHFSLATMRRLLKERGYRPGALKRQEGDGPEPGSEYRETANGIVWDRPTKDGVISVPLTNFTARVISEIHRDDGLEVTREFEIEAQLDGATYTFTVPAASFATMAWPAAELGVKAILYPGASIKDHARAAIQFLSGGALKRTIYCHLGWRSIPGLGWIYLFEGGFISPHPPEWPQWPQFFVETTLACGDKKFALPKPPEGSDATKAVRASLRFLSLGPDRITFPLYAGLWRASTDTVDFALFVFGLTGVFKTQLAALIQSHWGAGLDAQHLPGSWTSTSNALEKQAFLLANAVFVIDDFCPVGNSSDQQRAYRDLDRILRALGNHAGRGRMRADGSLRPTYVPQSLIVITGEELPARQSALARTLTIQVCGGEIAPEALTHAQHDAASGLYAGALAAFLRWASSRLDELRAWLGVRRQELRDQLRRSTNHRRTPTTIADLKAGFELFLRFATEIAAVTRAEARRLDERCWEALLEAAAAHADHIQASEPAQEFLDRIRSALSSGKAHLSAREGMLPIRCWHPRTVGGGRTQMTSTPRPSNGGRRACISGGSKGTTSTSTHMPRSKSPTSWPPIRTAPSSKFAASVGPSRSEICSGPPIRVEARLFCGGSSTAQRNLYCTWGGRRWFLGPLGPPSIRTKPTIPKSSNRKRRKRKEPSGAMGESFRRRRTLSAVRHRTSKTPSSRPRSTGWPTRSATSSETTTTRRPPHESGHRVPDAAPASSA